MNNQTLLNINDKSLDGLYDFLKLFHLSESLYHIGAINALLKHGFKKIDPKNIPENIIQYVAALSEHDRMVLSMSTTRLARFLLLSGANDDSGSVLWIGSPYFKLALDKAFNVYDEEVEVPINSELERSNLIGRITSWQMPLQVARQPIIGRGYLLFNVIAKRFAAEYDIDKILKENFGFNTIEFMATGMAMWIMASGIIDYELNVEVDYLKDIVTHELQLKFLDLSATTGPEYRAAMSNTDTGQRNKLREMYGLDPMTKTPVVRCEKGIKLREGTYVVPQAKYFLDRASSGIFYLLADCELAKAKELGNSGQNHFRRVFGNIYREYAGMQLKLAVSNISVIDIDTDIVYLRRKPDFALISGDKCLLFEIKTSSLKLDARTLFEEKTLREEVRSGSLEKSIRQLHEFKKAILERRLKDQRFGNINRVISIMIGYEEVFVLNSSVLPLMEEYYPELAEDLQFGCILDLETMGSSLASGNDLVNEIISKLENGSKYYPIDGYLINQKKIKVKNPITTNAFNEFINLMLGKMP